VLAFRPPVIREYTRSQKMRSMTVQVRFGAWPAALLGAVLPFVCAKLQAHAQSAKQSISVAVEIAPDLTVTRTTHLEATPLNAASVQALLQQRFAYTARQAVEIVDAYTRKADGTQVPVDQSQIVTQDGLVGPATTFADIKIKQIPFRDLGVGDTLVLGTRITEKDHYLPGQYTAFDIVPPSPNDVTYDLKLTAPTSLPLRHATHIMAYEENQAGDRIVRHWSGSFPASTISERDIANARFVPPSLQYSTLPSYEVLANAYFAAAAPQAQVTPTVQKMADAITADIKTPRDKAQAIFEWMTKNVQYVAIYFGNGAYVPNSADTILERRIGDCKDHATLMSALLAAAGIASQQVLIEIGSDHDLPEVPVVQAFNHVILYLPELDVYTDPTSPQTTFGVLHRSEMDKPVVRVSQQGAVVARTPVGQASDDVFKLDSTMMLNGAGQTVGETKMEATGEEAQLLREFVAAVETKGDLAVLSDIAKRRGIAGAFTIAAPSSRDHALPYKVAISWTGDDLAHMTDSGWRPTLGFSPVIPDLAHFFGQFDRTKSHLLVDQHAQESTQR